MEKLLAKRRELKAAYYKVDYAKRRKERSETYVPSDAYCPNFSVIWKYERFLNKFRGGAK